MVVRVPVCRVERWGVLWCWWRELLSVVGAGGTYRSEACRSRCCTTESRVSA